MLRLILALAIVLVSSGFKHGGPELPNIPTTDFTTSDWNGPGTPPCEYGPGSPCGDLSDFQEGAFRFECVASHVNWDDPIVAPGKRGGSAHLHMFFGNTLTDYSSTYTSLRTTGGGSCAGGPLNRTGYWFPALIKPGSSFSPTQPDDMVVIPDFITIYYKTPERREINPRIASGSNRFQVGHVRIPRGLRFIQGYNFSTGADGAFFWGCEDGNQAATIEALALLTDCTGQRIFVRFVFPRCWDGRLDSTDHRAHIVYQAQDGFGNPLCPDTSGYIPDITVIIWWSHDNPASDWGTWFLSCDRMPGQPTTANGRCFHTDWFGAWDTTISDLWQHECDGTERNARIRDGVSGELCDIWNGSHQMTYAGGTTPSGYVSPAVTTTSRAEVDRYMAIPARP